MPNLELYRFIRQIVKSSSFSREEGTKSHGPSPAPSYHALSYHTP